MAYLTPGVYVEEVSSGEKPIAGVGTGTGGFVGIAQRGPINKATLVTSWSEYLSVFGGYVNYVDNSGPTPVKVQWYMPYAVQQFFAEGGSKCYVVRIVGPDNVHAPATIGINGTAGGATLDVTATSAGVWGNDLAIAIDAATDKGLTGGFKLIVLQRKNADSPYRVIEEYDNLTLGNLSATDASPNVVFTNIATNTAAPAITVIYTAGKISNFGAVALAGGNDGLSNLSTAEFQGAPSDSAPTGIYAFDPIDDVNMIAMPDSHFIDLITTTDSSNLAGVAIGYCENRRDTFFVGDIPAGMTPAQAKAYKLSGFSSSFAALYYPWVKATFGATNVVMPPSGAVMGLISRVDKDRGVFKAPAGVIDGKLRSINGLERQVGHGEQEELNPKGVNVIRFFPGPGNVVWGARTCASGVDAEWHYINVRRYFMYVEETLDEGSQWVVFEPNTPALWGSVKRNISAFLTNEWRAGALFGNTAEEAFYVKVDAENNPPSVRNLGQLIIEIGIAPVKPAEFVIIRISQKTLTA